MCTAGIGIRPPIVGSPAPSPTPMNPPRAKAYSAWIVWKPAPSGSANGSSQLSTRVWTCPNRLYSTSEPTRNSAVPPRTYDGRPVATYSSARNTAKNRSAAPRSRWTTTMLSAIATITTIGARYGIGGRRSGPTFVLSSASSDRFSDR